MANVICINKVLTLHVLSFLRRMPVADPIFRDDNARPNQACIVDDFLHSNNVIRTVWRVISLDLSCIEHVCDVLGRLFRNVWSKTANCKIFGALLNRKCHSS